MTEFVCVTGTVIELKAGVAWGWGTSVATTTPLPVPNVNTFFGNTKDITITGTGVKLTVDTTKPVILELNITTAMGLVTSAYHSVSAGLWSNNAITTFVGGLDGIINTVTLTGLTPSTILRHNTDGVILDNASGNFSILHIIVPPANGFLAALPPTAGTPIPDLTTPSYTGTWSVKSNGGNTKLKSN